MRMVDALVKKWNKSKDGDLGPDYNVLLHLWRYEGFPDNDHLVSVGLSRFFGEENKRLKMSHLSRKLPD